MRKRNITLFITMLVIIISLTACSSETKTISNESQTIFLYQTENVQEYFNFLENFDESKYEIVDISTSLNLSFNGHGSDEFYMITYKIISE